MVSGGLNNVLDMMALVREGERVSPEMEASHWMTRTGRNPGSATASNLKKTGGACSAIASSGAADITWGAVHALALLLSTRASSVSGPEAERRSAPWCTAHLRAHALRPLPYLLWPRMQFASMPVLSSSNCWPSLSCVLHPVLVIHQLAPHPLLFRLPPPSPMPLCQGSCDVPTSPGRDRAA